jgi:hypothetical protein
MPITTAVPMTIETGRSAALEPVSENGRAREAMQTDLRDPVVAQAIKNVTGRHHTEDFWVISPHERTQAIYDEINRLDRARMNEAMPPRKMEAGKPSPSADSVKNAALKLMGVEDSNRDSDRTQGHLPSAHPGIE